MFVGLGKLQSNVAIRSISWGQNTFCPNIMILLERFSYGIIKKKMFIEGIIIAMIRLRRCGVRSVYSRIGCAFIVSEKLILYNHNLYNKKLLVNT